jgi:hypothetical protein
VPIAIERKEQERIRLQRDKRQEKERAKSAYWQAVWRYSTPEQRAQQAAEETREREADRKMALDLVDAGYQGAAKLYRGNPTTMRLLGRARDRLRLLD